jgi:S1-C subfamily serine protease
MKSIKMLLKKGLLMGSFALIMVIFTAPVAHALDFDTDDTYQSIYVVNWEDGQYKYTGSAFSIDQHYVITNQHVINGTDSVVLTTKNNETLSAKVVAKSKEQDVALLFVADKTLKPISLGDSSAVKNGMTFLQLVALLGLTLR